MIRKLAPYIREFKREAITSPVLILLESLCELMMPLLMAAIIDRGLNGDGGVRLILTCGAALIALSSVSMYCGVGAARAASRASQGFGRNLRAAIFGKIQSFSFADIDRFSSASLITRMTNDVTALQNTVNMSLRMLVRAPVQMISALMVCLVLNARLTLVLIFAIPLMCLIIAMLMKSTKRLFEIFQTKIDALNNSVQENLIAVRVVKAFVRDNYERQKFARANDELKEAGLNAVTHMVSIFPVMMICLHGATLLILWFGGHHVADGRMLTGELYSFYSYIAQVLMSVLMVAFTLLQVTRATACATRILEVLETDADIRDGRAETLPPRRGSVSFRNVDFKYRSSGSGDNVLQGIDLDIEPGEFVAIVGATGVGKSSLVNLIPRFYDVTGGCVLVDGMDVRDYPVEALRERIGMVLQKNVLFSGTIRENLLWGDANATEEEMIRAAQNAQAHDFIMSFPDGYDSFLEQGGVNVSGGQKQRLCIARAMLRKPAILILDDSTSAVDTVTEAAIRRSFKESLEGTTVIIIAQRISSVRYADKIVVLDDDHIESVGTHDELMEKSSIYREIWQSQQEGVIANG